MSDPVSARPLGVYIGVIKQPLETTVGSAFKPNAFALASWLEPVFMTEAGIGEVGELHCIADKHPEDAYALVSEGYPIQLQDANNVVMFDGIVAKTTLEISDKSENFTLIAYDHGSFILHRSSVRGQVYRSYNREVDFFENGAGTNSGLDPVADVQKIDSPCIFNPDGKPNATQEAYSFSGDVNIPAGNSTFLFEKPFRNETTSSSAPLFAIPWTVSMAVRYLLNSSTIAWSIDPTSYSDSVMNSTFGVFGDPVVSNINVQGDTLLQALRKILEPYNYGYRINASLNGNGKQTFNFYYRGGGQTIKQLHLSARGSDALASSSNTIHFRITNDASAVENTIYGFGDSISITTLCHTDPPANTNFPVLVQGWKDSDLNFVMDKDKDGNPTDIVNPFDSTFRRNYCNPDLITVTQGDDDDGPQNAYGVGRHWLVNLGEIPTETLEPLTSDLFGPNSINPRRLEKPEIFTKTTAGGLLSQVPITVEMSTDDGQTWGIVEKDWYEIDKESIGIVFTKPGLEKLGTWIESKQYTPGGGSYWQALNDEHLQIRIVCAIKSDQRVAYTRLNGGAAFPLAIERVFDNDGYNKVQYNSQFGGAVYYQQYQPLKFATDDTARLTSVINQHAAFTDRAKHGGVVVTALGFGSPPHVGDAMFTYQVGNEISSLQPRGIVFPVRPIIVRVAYKFQTMEVEIVLDDPKIRSVVGGAPITDSATLAEKRYHVSGPTPLLGATKVPFMPNASGPSETQKEYWRQGN